MDNNINMTSRKGYTLIEILIVIALFSILFSIALPNLEFYKGLREKQEISELRKDILFARNSAILDNRPYYVHFYSSINSYEIRTMAVGPPIKRKAFTSGLKISQREEDQTFGFTPKGTINDSGTLYINAGRGRRYVVSLTPATGRVGVKLE